MISILLIIHILFALCALGSQRKISLKIRLLWGGVSFLLSFVGYLLVLNYINDKEENTPENS